MIDSLAWKTLLAQKLLMRNVEFMHLKIAQKLNVYPDGVSLRHWKECKMMSVAPVFLTWLLPWRGFLMKWFLPLWSYSDNGEFEK